jgi:hypothetical protein
MTYLTSLGGGGGGTTLYTISATSTFTFTNEELSVVNTISNASLTNINLISFSVINSETSGASLDDFTLAGMTFHIENIINNTSFDIRATSTNGATGVYTITYKVIYS